MKERMPELRELEEIKKQKAEYKSGLNLRLIGCKKVTISDLERDVFKTSRYN